MAKKIYVLDTSVYLTDARAIEDYGTNDIVIPLKVLEEIDNHKTRLDTVGANARGIIRKLDALRSRGSLYTGVRIGRRKGLAFARPRGTVTLPEGLDPDTADNEILSTALWEKENNPGRKVIVVSRDINMRVKCAALNLDSEDYVAGHAVKNFDYLYSGFATHLVDDQIIDQVYEGKKVHLDKADGRFCPNQFIMLVSNANEKKTALVRFRNYSASLQRINEKTKLWGVVPRNKEQAFAINLLINPKVSIVSMTGKAGSGKTLMAIAAGLEQVLESEQYKKLVVSRPVQPLGKDIGYLPGSMEEKMMPWLAPVQDNLQFLLNNDKATLDMYIDNGTIEISALTYIRGRSISNAFMIIDEAQNLTVHELKTIITRVGEGTKVILTGDVEQIDNVYVNETTNGLSYAIQKFKNYDLSGHITLNKGERSKVATLAAKIL